MEPTFTHRFFRAIPQTPVPDALRAPFSAAPLAFVSSALRAFPQTLPRSAFPFWRSRAYSLLLQPRERQRCTLRARFFRTILKHLRQPPHFSALAFAPGPRDGGQAGPAARRAKRARGCLRAPGSYVSCRIAAIPLFCGRPHICRPPDDGPAPAGGASAEPFDVPLASSAARRAAPALCSPGIIPQAVRAPRPPRVRRRRESARRFVLPPLHARAARFRKRA